MTMAESPERAERRARQRELADRLKASGALDGIFEQIDAGQVPLGGDDGLLKGMLKAALERGLEVELTDHLGYERGDPDASQFPNSRNGTTPKTVASEIGDVELAVPRDRDGTFTPRLVPKGARRLGGLDEMIISLYAGGMTVRDIQHHLASTIGTELSPRDDLARSPTRSLEEVQAWQTRPLEAFYPVIYLDALVVKVRDGAPRAQQGRPHRRRGRPGRHQARAGDLGAGHRGRQVLGRGVRRARQPRRHGRADRVLRRAHRVPRGDRGDLAARDRADLRGAPDPGRDAVRVLQRPQSRRRRAASRSTPPPTPTPR